jgi:uncharacterized protein (TIGR02145 family)
MRPFNILSLLLFSAVISINSFCQNTVTDISGNVYKTVKIGTQIWMAENLRTEKFNNGDPIEQITSNRYWQEVSGLAMNDTTFNQIWPVMCYYNNEKQKHNALYNWYVVFDSRGVCPAGWHIPSTDEFYELIDYLGGMETASTKLKSSTSWKIIGSNSSGFNAIPIGFRVGSGEFNGESEEVGFWTDEIIEDRNQINNILYLGASTFKLRSDITKTEIRSIFFNAGHSIRCVKN